MFGRLNLGDSTKEINKWFKEERENRHLSTECTFIKPHKCFGTWYDFYYCPKREFQCVAVDVTVIGEDEPMTIKMKEASVNALVIEHAGSYIGCIAKTFKEYLKI